MHTRLPTALAVIGLLACAAPTKAEEPYLDPTASCSAALSGDSEHLFFAAAYAFGYNNAVHNTIRPIIPSSVPKVLGLLRDQCLKDPGQSFHQAVVAVIGKAQTGAPPAKVIRSGRELEAEGKQLLKKFLDPATDKAALTWSLKPRPEDVRAAYREPLASALIAGYDKLFKPGVAIGGKPGQTDMRTLFTHFSALQNGKKVLREFPGGYEKVLPYMITAPGSDPVIARFVFVQPGETRGMAFDGLIHVNGRWVFMPKPWRVIPQE